MFYKRPWLIGLVISLGWHLFWISAVSIVILPNHLTVSKYPPVNFLGRLFPEINIPISLSRESKDNSNLDSKIEEVIFSLHPENEVAPLFLKSKVFPEAFPEIGGEKEIPDLLVLVSLGVDNLANQPNQWPLDKNIKYLSSDDGRVVLINRLLTGSDPEEDILKIRNLYQERFY